MSIVLFPLLGPADVAVDAAPGADVHSCMQCYWVGDSQLKIWVTLDFQLTFLIYSCLLCSFHFLLTEHSIFYNKSML